MSDFTYVENVAHAHVCAAEALTSQNLSVAGKVSICMFLLIFFNPVWPCMLNLLSFELLCRHFLSQISSQGTIGSSCPGYMKYWDIKGD